MSTLKEGDKFWLEDICLLFTEPAFFPGPGMTRNEKLNALTRLAILITCVLYFMDYPQWLTFLGISVGALVLMAYMGSKKSISEPAEVERQKENFTIVPTYTGTDFQQTIVSPTYSEEWQVPPPAYDLYTQVPHADNENTFETPLKPQSYPYGQYLTKTNLLPSDEYYTHLGCGGSARAREYQNSAFLRHRIAFQDNMSRIYKKKLERRFRSNGTGSDTFSPYYSF